MTAVPARSALLYDTAASLRLVDTELRALDVPPAAAAEPAAPAAPAAGSDPALRAHLRALIEAPAEQPVGLAALPYILERVHSEVYAVLANLRESRAAIESATVENLQHTSARLQEVTSATEVAATDILDSLDRAGQIVDDLDAEEADAASDAPKRGPELRAKLREEIFGMMGALQFQDITTQQLAYASSVLIEMETRIAEVARLFAPGSAIALAVPAAAAPEAPAPSTFDPNATTLDAETRQALADAIFTAR